jgi:hypothetical protein
MMFVLEDYMEEAKLSEADRELLRKQALHSISCYGVNGEHLGSDSDREDLLVVLMGMQRFVLDTNSLSSLGDASLPVNRNKAFILGQTLAEEVENLQELLFGHKLDNSNNNLFAFGLVGPKVSGLPVPYLTLDRLDSHYRIVFDAKRLREESRERGKRTDAEFIQREWAHTANVEGLKHDICSEILRWPDIADLPPPQYTERKKSQLVQIIRSGAVACCRDWWNAVRVASLCYAALLLEQDQVGKKTRKEFCDPARRNVFGDTRLVADALWLNARILSKDAAVKRMAGYLRVPDITVTESP